MAKCKKSEMTVEVERLNVDGGRSTIVTLVLVKDYVDG